MNKTEKMPKDFNFGTIPEALEDLRNGRIILVTDDPDRENEGDLICAGEFATTENINFIASEAKGLMCMPMGIEAVKRLNLPQMVDDNEDNHETAFTVSIDHVDTTTGISAIERGLTARMAADPSSKPEDFRRPGHMFPLTAKNEGVFKRTGHTEATVDLLRLAGLEPVGICCEIMSSDGSMMRKPELAEFAKKHGITFVTISDLKEYRKKFDKLVECVSISHLPTKYGDFMAHAYINTLNGEHHIALVKGDISGGEDILCRVHSECLTGDAFGSLRCDCGDQLHTAMQQIEAAGKGILLYMRQEGRGIGLINKLKAYKLQDGGMDTLDANLALGFPADMRDYYIGAQILKDLGVHTMHLLTNNPDKVYKLGAYGMEITKRIPIQIPATKDDLAYLRTKKERMGHILDC